MSAAAAAATAVATAAAKEIEELPQLIPLVSALEIYLPKTRRILIGRGIGRAVLWVLLATMNLGPDAHSHTLSLHILRLLALRDAIRPSKCQLCKVESILTGNIRGQFHAKQAKRERKRLFFF